MRKASRAIWNWPLIAGLAFTFGFWSVWFLSSPVLATLILIVVGIVTGLIARALSDAQIARHYVARPR